MPGEMSDIQDCCSSTFTNRNF